MKKTKTKAGTSRPASTANPLSKAHAINPDAIQPIDLNSKALAPGSDVTPFSAFLWAVVSGDTLTAEAQLADGVEWGLMPYNKVLKGKDQVIPWLRAAAADKKKPVVISNATAGNWGVFEYWNIGTVSDEVIKLGNEQGWPWPDDPEKFKGKEYRVAQCFTYHVNDDGKIDFMRQYLDTGSVFAQFK